MRILLEIVCALIMVLPTYPLAVFMDRKGDKHPNLDNLIIAFVIFLAAGICLFIGEKNIVQYALLGASYYVLFFPWLISLHLVKIWKNVELKKGIEWYNHFSDTAIPDRWEWWRIHWIKRLVIQLIVITGPLLIYDCWKVWQSFECLTR
jgi:hypothetical protein